MQQRNRLQVAVTFDRGDNPRSPAHHGWYTMLSQGLLVRDNMRIT